MSNTELTFFKKCSLSDTTYDKCSIHLYSLLPQGPGNEVNRIKVEFGVYTVNEILSG